MRHLQFSLEGTVYTRLDVFFRLSDDDKLVFKCALDELLKELAEYAFLILNELLSLIDDDEHLAFMDHSNQVLSRVLIFHRREQNLLTQSLTDSLNESAYGVFVLGLDIDSPIK